MGYLLETGMEGGGVYGKIAFRFVFGLRCFLVGNGSGCGFAGSGDRKYRERRS